MELNERDILNILQGRAEKLTNRKVLWRMGVGGLMMIIGLGLTAYSENATALHIIGWFMFAVGLGVVYLGYRLQQQCQKGLRAKAVSFFQANKGLKLEEPLGAVDVSPNLLKVQGVRGAPKSAVEKDKS